MEDQPPGKVLSIHRLGSGTGLATGLVWRERIYKAPTSLGTFEPRRDQPEGA